MERQEIINLIQKEVRREGKKLSGDIEGGVNQFPNDRIMKSDDDGRLQPHASITATELSRLEGFLDAAVVTHSSVGTAADTSTSLATAGAVKQAISNLVAAAPGHLNTLDELAAALQDDASFATTITSALSGKAPVFTAGNHLSFSGIGTLQLNVNAPDDTACGTNGDTGLITSNAVFDGLATKQATIADGDLSIARTSGLQSALNAKAAILAIGDVLEEKAVDLPLMISVTVMWVVTTTKARYPRRIWTSWRRKASGLPTLTVPPPFARPPVTAC